MNQITEKEKILINIFIEVLKKGNHCTEIREFDNLCHVKAGNNDNTCVIHRYCKKIYCSVSQNKIDVNNIVTTLKKVLITRKDKFKYILDTFK